MKPWKRDLAYIREVGPDEPRFDEATAQVWEHIEELEAALREIDESLERSSIKGGWTHSLVRKALS